MLTATLLSLALATPARAEEPLAIPVGAHPPPAEAAPPEETPDEGTQTASRAVQARAAAPVDPQARALAMQQYRNQHLSLQPEYSVNHTSSVSYGFGWGWGWGPRRGPWGPRPAVAVGIAPGGYAQVDMGWGIYEGAQRMDVPDYLTALGETQRSVDLQIEIDRYERRETAWQVVGGVGLATMIGGFVGSFASPDPEVRVLSYDVMLLGGLTALGGFAISSVPGSQAFERRSRPSRWMDRGQVQAEIDAYNRALAAGLGLSANDMMQVESTQPHQHRVR